MSWSHLPLEIAMTGDRLLFFPSSGLTVKVQLIMVAVFQSQPAGFNDVGRNSDRAPDIVLVAGGNQDPDFRGHAVAVDDADFVVH